MSRSSGYAVDGIWRAVLLDLGVRPGDVLRRAGLAEDLFSRPNARLSTAEYFGLWRALDVEVDDPLYPLLLANSIGHVGFSPPIFAAMCSPNFAVAASRLSIYKRLIAPMALRIESDEDTFSFSIEWLNPVDSPPLSLVATELVFFVALIRYATRHEVVPVAVSSTYDLPQMSHYTPYFGVPLKQGDRHGVVFLREDVERPFLMANEEMWEVFEPRLKTQLDQLTPEATTAERVRAILLKALPSGQFAMEDVARKLAVSKRTLQRRLKEDGASYQAVLKQTRKHLAEHYLIQTSMSPAEISFMLGFEEPNSFYRAFSGWTGSTPERVRQSQRA